MDLQPIIDSLTHDFQVVLHEFDAITSIPSFLSHKVLLPGADYGLLARLQYVSGNLNAASSLSERLGGEGRSTLDIRGLTEGVKESSIDEVTPHKNGNRLRFLLWDGPA
jgi:hypothetical protein